MHNARSIKSWLVWLLLTIPFVGYLGNVVWYAVNMPVWDDYLSLLEPVNSVMTLPDWRDKWHALFMPQNGFHPFVVERLIMLLQVAMGGINFAYYVWLANFGWALTAAILVFYFGRILGAPLFYLLPIPYLMLSSAHWEAMDFATSAFQYYWGGGAFAVLSIVLAVMGRGVGAGIACALALLSFGGSQALLPLLLLVFLGTRRWKAAALFVLVVGMLVTPYLYLNGIPQGQGSGISQLLSNPVGVMRYVLIFMGNYFSTGHYDLVPLNTVFLCVGSLVLAGTVALLWFGRSQWHEVLLPVAVVAYVLLLAAMAALVRFDISIVPRYSMYALLAGAALYGGYVVVWAPGKSAVYTKAVVTTVLLASMGYWIYTLYVTQILFRENRQQRLEGMTRYIQENDISALSSFCWNAAFADGILRQSRELGVYDYTQFDRR
jgi:hypothetical protein